MGWAETFIAVDWGTTNRRAWRIAGGGVEAEFEDGRGVLAIEGDTFPAAVAEIRERLGNHPMLLAGMVGSNRGWAEAPYVPCPAGLDDLVGRLCWPEPGRTAIVPGLSSADPPDVMRGEEVQIFGAIGAGLAPKNGLVCHPGTHNKWVHIEDGRIARFRTVMTGEMFSLLKEHSILSDLLAADAVTVDEPFRDGVRRGLAGVALTAELFAVRAGVLLGARRKEDAGDYVSGLLIGADIAFGAGGAAQEILVMGRAELTRLYAAGLDVAGLRPRQIDGEAAFIAGIQAIAGRL